MSIRTSASSSTSSREPGWFSCSGTLMDEDTFLTAGHCTFGVGVEGAVDPDGTGGTDMWVSFDDDDVLAGWPARADYDTEEALYAARSAWLDGTRRTASSPARPSHTRSTTTSRSSQ